LKTWPSTETLRFGQQQDNDKSVGQVGHIIIFKNYFSEHL